jgi:hypothetical protein
MAALKATLESMGSHPPVGIDVEVKRQGIRRVTGTMSDLLTSIGNKAAGLSELTLRLGPFTGSLKQFAIALSFLGPTITDLLGATGALVGVLGSGISGAAALGAGALTGFATAGLGLLFSTRNTRQELTQARTSINAYQNAVLKYGRSADKTKTKQEEMNSVLRQISPLARETALGTEKFFDGWDKGSKQTQENLGRISKDGFGALNDLRDQWASRTNEFSGMLADGLSSAFDFLRGPEGSSLIDGIMGDFNKNTPKMLSGLGAFAEGFLRFAREGARNLDILSGGIDNLGNKFRDWTKSDDFGTTIRRWSTDARDLMRLFGAMGRVTMHFFGAGSRAGLGLVHAMTDALNEWDKKLTSTSGRKGVASGFERAADGARALWNAIAPMAGAFLQWSSNLSPFVTGLLHGVGFVSEIVGGVTKLVGLTGAVGTLGATLGAMWAVGKIGAFVSYLARAVELLRTMSAMNALKTLASGGIFKALRGGGSASLAAAGQAAAAEMRAGIISGGTIAAAELRAAMATGGVPGLPGKARSAKDLILPASMAGGAEAGATAITGIGLASAAAAVGVAALAVGTGYLIYRLTRGKSEAEKLTEVIREHERAMSVDRKGTEMWAGAQTKASQASSDAKKTLSELRKERDAAAKGSARRRELEIQVFEAEQKRNRAAEDGIYAARTQKKNSADEIRHARQEISAIQQRTEAKKREAEIYSRGDRGPNAAANLRKRLAAIDAEGTRQTAAAQDKLTAALNRQAAAQLNVARARRHLSALTGKDAQRAGALAIQRPGLASKIAVKYDTPKNVGDVSNAARRALGSGVRLKTVLHIVADSKNAEDALRRLRTAEVNKKMVKFGITGDGGVLSKLSAIDRKEIKRKIAHIIERGGTPTLAKIQDIIQRQIQDKSFNINAKVGQAIAQMNLVAAGLSRIQSKSIMISVNKIERSFKDRAPGAGHAEGGIATAASKRGAWPGFEGERTRGGMYDKPKFLVGEEHRPEFVIATNPAYRENNIRYLMQAADALGVPMYAKGKGYKKGAKAGGKAITKARKRGTIPPKLRDYISDVDLSDLATMDSDAWEAYKEQRDKVNDWAKMSGKERKGKHAPSKTAMNERKGFYDRIHSLHKKAIQKKAAFDNLETDIDALRTSMESANRSDDGRAEYKGKSYTFQQLKDMRGTLINDRTGLLRAAQGDLPSKGPATKTAWYHQINKALGESIREAQDNAAEEATPKPLTEAQQAALDSVQAYGDPNAAGILAGLQKNLAISQMNDVPDDPATLYTNENAASLADNLQPAKDLQSFWEGVFARLTAPGSGATDAAITSAATEVSSAREAVRGLLTDSAAAATTTQAEQYQMLSNARSDLYSSFASNAMPILGPSAGFSGGAFGPNMGGAPVKNVVINNTFPTPPGDPHIWSQGVSWELQNAI